MKLLILAALATVCCAVLTEAAPHSTLAERGATDQGISLNYHLLLSRLMKLANKQEAVGLEGAQTQKLKMPGFSPDIFQGKEEVKAQLLSRKLLPAYDFLTRRIYQGKKSIKAQSSSSALTENEANQQSVFIKLGGYLSSERKSANKQETVGLEDALMQRRKVPDFLSDIIRKEKESAKSQSPLSASAERCVCVRSPCPCAAQQN